jgi:HlyD family secretion protein
LRNPQALDQRIHEAQTQVALAEQQVQFQDAELRNVQYRFDRQKVSEWELRQAKAAYAGAQADLEAARALVTGLEEIRRWPLPYIAQTNMTRGQYNVAVVGVEVARAQLADVQAGPTIEELAVADAKIRQAEADVQKLEVRIAKCTLTSPIEGVVLEQLLHAGELAAPAAPILTLGALDEVRLEVYVPEPRIGHVSRGQPVTVTVDSFPSRAFAGQVVHIGDEPEYTPRNVATAEGRRNTFYAVEIQLSNPEHLLKPGMPADARFE